MDRERAKFQEKENEKLLAKFEYKPEEFIIEKEKSIQDKIIFNETYTVQDIKNVAKKSYDVIQRSQLYEDEFKLFENYDAFDTSILKKLTHSKPLFIVYGKRENYWILLILLKDARNTKIQVFYKDPFSDELENKIRYKIQESTEMKIDFIVNKKALNNYNINICGAITMRNFHKSLEFYHNYRNQFLEKFRDSDFFLTHEFNIYKLDRVVEIVTELAEKKRFTEAFNRFIELPVEKCKEICKYTQLLSENKPENYKEIQKTREELMSKKNMQDIYRDSSRIFDKYNALVIEKEFSTELKLFNDLCTVLNQMNVDENLKCLLPKICTRLNNINYQLLSDYLEVKIELVDGKNFNKKIEKKPAPEISLPTEEQSLEIQQSTTSFDDVIGKMENTDKLKQKYKKIQESYNKNESFDQITKWIFDKRHDLDDNDAAICEVLGIIDRVLDFEMKIRLQPNVVISVLELLKDKSNKFCELLNDDDRYLVIVITSIIKTLQGNRVDIVTDKNLHLFQKLYDIFKITISKSHTGDVVYGKMGYFQFDILRKKLTKEETREYRSLDVVIFDNIEYLLVNDANVAKLSQEFPGSECLRYVYIKIWQALSKVLVKFETNTKAEIEQIRSKYQSEEIAEYEAINEIEVFLASENKNFYDFFKQEMKQQTKILDSIPFSADYLKKFALNNWNRYIENAILAKFTLRENEDYLIEDGKIKPIDRNFVYSSKNVVWSSSLYQFVQLKHNLRLTTETITNISISSNAFIEKYKQYFVVSNTKGSPLEEEKYITLCYQMTDIKMPQFNKFDLKKVQEKWVDDELWAQAIIVDALEHFDSQSVLIILQNPAEVNLIQNHFTDLIDKEKIKTPKSDFKIDSNEIVIITFSEALSMCLKVKTEFHVIVGFLPINQRYEYLAVRYQKPEGTAKIIAKFTEVNHFPISLRDEADASKAVLHHYRDKNEAELMEKIDIENYRFQDKMHEKFSDYLNDVKEDYIAKDCIERWAFFMYHNNAAINATFETFEEQAKQEALFNKLHSLKFLSEKDPSRGEAHLKQLWKLNEALDDSPGHNILGFQFGLKNAGNLLSALYKVVSEVIKTPALPDSQLFTREALNYLQRAETLIKLELKYIEDNIMNPDNNHLNGDFEKIVIKQGDFLQYFTDRYDGLNTHKQITNGLFQNFLKWRHLDILIEQPMFTHETTLSPIVIEELKAIGLDITNVLEKIQNYTEEEEDDNYSKTIIEKAKEQIRTGVLILKIAKFLPMTSVVGLNCAGTCFMEAIYDLISIFLGVRTYAKYDIIKPIIDSLNLKEPADAQFIGLITKVIFMLQKIDVGYMDTKKFKSNFEFSTKTIQVFEKNVTREVSIKPLLQQVKLEFPKQLSKFLEDEFENDMVFAGKVLDNQKNPIMHKFTEGMADFLVKRSGKTSLSVVVTLSKVSLDDADTNELIGDLKEEVFELPENERVNSDDIKKLAQTLADNIMQLFNRKLLEVVAELKNDSDNETFDPIKYVDEATNAKEKKKRCRELIVLYRDFPEDRKRIEDVLKSIE